VVIHQAEILLNSIFFSKEANLFPLLDRQKWGKNSGCVFS
jgi:hypothetical protein